MRQAPVPVTLGSPWFRVVDTGVGLSHPDLLASWRGGSNSWYDPYGHTTQPNDAHGHGTGTDPNEGGALATWMFAMRGSLRTILACLVGLACVLHIVMKAPVWHLIARITVFDASTGWHRYWVIDQSLRHIGDWWLLGTTSTLSWEVLDITLRSDKLVAELLAFLDKAVGKERYTLVVTADGLDGDALGGVHGDLVGAVGGALPVVQPLEAAQRGEPPLLLASVRDGEGVHVLGAVRVELGDRDLSQPVAVRLGLCVRGRQLIPPILPSGARSDG